MIPSGRIQSIRYQRVAARLNCEQYCNSVFPSTGKKKKKKRKKNKAVIRTVALTNTTESGKLSLHTQTQREETDLAVPADKDALQYR